MAPHLRLKFKPYPCPKKTKCHFKAGEDDLEGLVAAVKRFYLTDPFKETDKDIRLTKVLNAINIL